MAIIEYIENQEFGFFDPEAPKPISIDMVQFSVHPVFRIELVEDPKTKILKARFTEALPVEFFLNEACHTNIFGRPFETHRFRGCLRDDTGLLVDKSRDSLVKVEYPWSNRQIGMGCFHSRCSKFSDFERKVENRIAAEAKKNNISEDNDLLYPALCNQVIRKEAAQSTYDPWESRKEYFSAPVYETSRISFASIRNYKVRDLGGKSRSSAKGKQKQSTEKPRWLLSVVRDIEEVKKNLHCSERITKLLEQAENGTLQIPNHQKNADSSTQNVVREFADVSLNCMDLAIRQALGGPSESGDTWMQTHGPNVEEVVAIIFKSHASNYQRHVLKNSKQAGPGDWLSQGGSGDDSESDDWDSYYESAQE